MKDVNMAGHRSRLNLAEHDSDDRSTLNHNNLFHDDV